MHAPRPKLRGKAALLDLAFSRIQGWQTRRAVAISNHRTSRGPHREAWMLHRLDTFHLEYPTARSPARKPTPSTNGTLSLVRLNVPHSWGNAVTQLKCKKIRNHPHPALCRALKLARSNHCYAPLRRNLSLRFRNLKE